MRSLRLSHEQVKTILDVAADAHPHEVCGMIGGHGSVAESIVTIPNAASKPEYHYQLEPQAQIKTLSQFERDNLEWLAVFHSHPNGKPIPSQEDIRDAMLNTPNLIHLIVGMQGGTMRLQAWHVHDGQVDEVELLIGNQASEGIQPVSRLEMWAIVFAILVGVGLLLAISFTLLPPAPPIPTPQ